MNRHDELRQALTQLPRTRMRPGAWCRGCCPAHDDQNPSLGWKEDTSGGLALKCHAGCSTEDILDSLGFNMTDLFPPSGTAGPRLVRARVPAPAGDHSATAHYVGAPNKTV